ncbi:MAG: site-specific DNA-methyltransferase [Candidatus Absconditabacterales bacterium]
MSKYDKLSNEELLRLIEQQEIELETKKYGLVRNKEKEPEKVVLECEHNLPILERVFKKEIKTDETDDNILIEGDNYHALTVLNYTHSEKIDIIYIDPPYNTGNKDFIYNDKYVDKEDGYRHSKRLNFMEKRLKLAKNILKKSGVIFISIDDNEQSQLKLLCDGIFGENNFISKIVIQSNPRGSQASKHLAEVHEYVLVYAKSSNDLNIEGLPKSEENLSEYSSTDKQGKKYRLLGLRQRGGERKREQRPNMFYPLYVNPKDNTISLQKTKTHFIEALPKRPTGEEGRWTWSKDKVNSDIGLLIGKKVNRKDAKNFYDIFRVDYLSDEDGIESMSKPKTIWLEKELNYQNGRNEIKDIFGEDLFDYPKPTFLIKKIVEMVGNKNALIVDFFCCSGTTGHAILKLNNQDGGNRRFILCTNNENKICEEVTYPRIKKVIKGYDKKTGDKEWIEGSGGNLQYFKTSLIKETVSRDQLKINLTGKCTEILCIKENIFNLEQEKDDYKIFTSNQKDKYLCIHYNFKLNSFNEFIANIKKIKGEKTIYTFSLDNVVDESLFKGVDNFRIEPIPQNILNVYKQLIILNIKNY